MIIVMWFPRQLNGSSRIKRFGSLRRAKGFAPEAARQSAGRDAYLLVGTGSYLKHLSAYNRSQAAPIYSKTRKQLLKEPKPWKH